MAITHNLPLREWYFNNVSEWTLDYPPFFAYFEKGLSTVARFVDPEMLVLQEKPYMSENLLLFHRLSVIATDTLYVCEFPRSQSRRSLQSLGSMCLAEAVVSSLPVTAVEFKFRMKLGLFVLLSVNPGLALLDNIHFQYNSMLFGIFCLAIAAAYAGRPLLVGSLPFSRHQQADNNCSALQGAFLFATLLNFKHIYLYYVPAFVGFYLMTYLLRDYSPVGVFQRTVSLAVSLAVPLVVSFGPFFAQGTCRCQQHIVRVGCRWLFTTGTDHEKVVPFQTRTHARILGAELLGALQRSRLLPVQNAAPHWSHRKLQQTSEVSSACASIHNWTCRGMREQNNSIRGNISSFRLNRVLSGIWPFRLA